MDTVAVKVVAISGSIVELTVTVAGMFVFLIFAVNV